MANKSKIDTVKKSLSSQMFDRYKYLEDRSYSVLSLNSHKSSIIQLPQRGLRAIQV